MSKMYLKYQSKSIHSPVKCLANNVLLKVELVLVIFCIIR